MITLKLRIENRYKSGTQEVVVTEKTTTVPPPPRCEGDGFSDWEWEQIFPLTGTGRRTAEDSWYDVEVLESSDPAVIPVGTTYEFGY